jgi:hypothetical protein
MSEKTLFDELQILCFRKRWNFVEASQKSDFEYRLVVDTYSRDLPSDVYRLTLVVNGSLIRRIHIRLDTGFDYQRFVRQLEQYEQLLSGWPKYRYEAQGGHVILSCRESLGFDQVEETVDQLITLADEIFAVWVTS